MEMSLDRYYFKQLEKAIGMLSGVDREMLDALLGKNTDLLNIQWIYRGKKFYGLSSEELYNYCLESGRKFRGNQLKDLCYVESLEEYKKKIEQTEYAILFSQDEIMMEKNMERFIFNLINQLIKKGGESIIVPLGYLHKLEYEMRDLFTVLEGLKYSEKNMNNYLVREL